MTCKTPGTGLKYQELQNRSNRKKRAAEEPTKLEFGFIIGDVQPLLEWSSKNNATLDYFSDPVYDTFKANPETYNGTILILTVSFIFIWGVKKREAKVELLRKLEVGSIV